MVTVDRYALHGEIASGGTATVYFARVHGSAGFRRVVAVKRLHAELAKDAQFRAMLLDEARIAARIRHPNVVPVIDVVDVDDELCLVMDYVPGATLSRLRLAAVERELPVPPAIAVAVVVDALRGLHAAHEATGADGEPLHLVHRDVSPQNVIVGADGIARVVDFGIAKAVGSAQTTRVGDVKGKAAYMAPEQLRGEAVDRRCDVFAAGIVLWELLCAKRLFAADSPAASMMRVLELQPEAPSSVAAGVEPALDAAVLRALSRDRDERFATAEAMADALQAAIDVAAPREVAIWVHELDGETLRARAAEVSAIESIEAPAAPMAVTETAASSPAPPPARMLRVLGALAAVILVGLVARSVLHARDATTVASDAQGAGPSASVESVRSAVVSLVSAPPPAIEPPVAAVDARADKPAAAATTPTLGRPRAPSRAFAPARTTKGDRCSPPYVVDPQGIHVMKPECL
ncbi:MAG: eukaryotic-like serine/threonine-protein kinase [Myxococcales bacterium]|nr:eukaryotic-like serine/threonine-protein kinase [Myxococcales bacterium]